MAFCCYILIDCQLSPLCRTQMKITNGADRPLSMQHTYSKSQHYLSTGSPGLCPWCKGHEAFSMKLLADIRGFNASYGCKA